MRYLDENGEWQGRSAVGYVAKYITKATTAAGLDNSADSCRHPNADWANEDEADSAERVRCWASIWRIRQFQQFGGPPVGVYRELRRIREKSETILEPHREAADNGNWAGFCETSRKLPARVAREQTGECNQYGELAPAKTIGVECGGHVMNTRTRNWAAIASPVDQVIFSTDPALQRFVKTALEVVNLKFSDSVGYQDRQQWPNVVSRTRGNNCTDNAGENIIFGLTGPPHFERYAGQVFHRAE